MHIEADPAPALAESPGERQHVRDFASPRDPKRRQGAIGDETGADAVLDRLAVASLRRWTLTEGVQDGEDAEMRAYCHWSAAVPA